MALIMALNADKTFVEMISEFPEEEGCKASILHENSRRSRLFWSKYDCE
jgi:hypothetical protein